LKGLYNENIKIPKKETEEDTRRDLCSWIGRINVVKMAVTPKSICKFGAIPIKISMPFFINIEKQTLKLILKHVRSPIGKVILSKKQGWRYHNI
jgi:hypothetical protein